MRTVGRSDSRTVGRMVALAAFLSVSPTVRLAAFFLLLAACQPQATKALLLDLALSDPVVVESVAEPWHAAGYRVEYRQFYPHLTHQDLDRYRVVLLLGGRRPEVPSDALTVGDLALLRAWVARGGVVVWGYDADGEGFGDRWTMNRWLAWTGAGILVGDYALRDTSQRSGPAFEPQPRASPLPQSALRRGGFQPFAFGRNHVLVVERSQQALARTSAAAFVRAADQRPAPRRAAPVVAARRIDDGLVIVTSRHALAVAGLDFRLGTAPATAFDDVSRARAYLIALARWTRRPAEWALVPPARPREPLQLDDAPIPVSFRPPRAAPPAGAGAIELPLRGPATRPRVRGLPDWMTRQGVRLLWGRFPGTDEYQPPMEVRQQLDSVVAFLDVGGFNLLASEATAPPQPVADTVTVGRSLRFAPRGRWRDLIERLQTTSLRWLPAIEPGAFRLGADPTAVGFHGDTLEAWCALDSRLWDGGLVPAYRALARLSVGWPDLIPAVALDLGFAERESGPGLEVGFCDSTYRAGLERLVRDTVLDAERATMLAALPAAARYDSLLETGLLAPYYTALEQLVAERAAAVRAEALGIRPDLLFAFRSSRLPADWFALGVLRGFGGGRDAGPLLLLTHEVRARGALARYQRRGIAAVHVLGLTPAEVAPSEWARLRRAAFVEHDGFWLETTEDVLAGRRAPTGRISADSLGRLIRRLSKER